MEIGTVTLAEYRRAYGVSYAYIARIAGVTPQAISAYARGETRPSWEVAGRIERATRGKVERVQWFPEDPKGGGDDRE
jgi:transcriptional regulator with XRE-family HTH domain